MKYVLVLLFALISTNARAEIDLGVMTPINSAVEMFMPEKPYKVCAGVNISNDRLTEKEVTEMLNDAQLKRSGAIYCKAMKCEKCDAVIINGRTK